MTSHQLPNYVRSNRKRLGLSQDEVAFLLGVQDGTKVCRYEQFDRQPSLETALAFEVIFQRPVSEILGGLYQRVEADVTARARSLAETTGNGKASKGSIRKRHIFTSIANKSFITS